MTFSGEMEETILVRNLRPDDLEAVIRVDAKNGGRRREEYFNVKLKQNLAETGVKISLAAEKDGLFVGFLLARLFYGEFGAPEPVAVLDTFGVHPDFRRQGIGSGLLRQLNQNLGGLGVNELRTEVNWDDQDLLTFFHDIGFQPAQRLCLNLDLTERRV
jgi:ribosomal protein S18 acetylase RimI-like enzyme